MAEGNVQKLLDMLYEMIDEAKNAPLSNDKCVLNRDEALDLLDEIRAQMPVELKRAQELVRARDEYVEAAKRDVERMMQKAEFEAKSKPRDTTSSPAPRSARARCTAWQTTTPRTFCAARRRPFRWRSTRSSRRACASVRRPTSRCSAAVRN